LEEGEDDAPGDARKAHLEAFTLFLHLEKVKKDIQRGRDAQIPTKNLKTPHEGPAVGMKLGRGGVDFGKQLPFEESKGETQAHSLEYHLVDEEEGTSPGSPCVHTNGFPRLHTTYEDVGIVGFVEGVEIVERGVPPVGLYVFDGGQCRALRKEFIGGPSVFLLVVGPGGWWSSSGFVSRHRIKS